MRFLGIGGAGHRSGRKRRRPEGFPVEAELLEPGSGSCRAAHSSGGKDKLGSISNQGDHYLRSLFTAGALAVIRYAKIHGTKHRPWLTALPARRAAGSETNLRADCRSPALPRHRSKMAVGRQSWTAGQG